MSRPTCIIKHDEVTRLVKPLLALGLNVARVQWDGKTVSVIIGDSGENAKEGIDVDDVRDSPDEVETL